MHYDGDVRWRCMITQMVAKLAINHDQYCKMGFLIVTDFISFFSYWSGGFDSLESSTHVNIICLNQAWVQLLEMTILEAIDWIGWWWWWWNWPMKKDFTTANVWTYSWWFVDRYWGSIFHFLTDRKEESMVMMTIRHFQWLLSHIKQIQADT